jgi:outer membrane protein assembly factor BamC
MMLRQIFALSLVFAALSGCSLVSKNQKDVDYRAASKGPNLDIPPDLAKPKFDDRYIEKNAGFVTATGQVVLPKADKVRLERNGDVRFLVVNERPEVLWPAITAFWQELGFAIAVNRPEAGVMETDWLEDRAKIEDSFLRQTLKRFIDGLYSSGTRDKFRVRLERVAEGTEIYLSHRGLEEKVISTTDIRWVMSPASPDLEAEMLNRLLVKLGFGKETAQQVASQAKPASAPAAAVAVVPKQADRATRNNSADGFPQVQLDDAFDRAWRRVGVALDRIGFTVVDRDRSQGIYYVRFADEAKLNKEDSIFDKVQFWKSTDNNLAEQYRITVKDNNNVSSVRVYDKNGVADKTDLSVRMLNLLQTQLK